MFISKSNSGFILNSTDNASFRGEKALATLLVYIEQRNLHCWGFEGYIPHPPQNRKLNNFEKMMKSFFRVRRTRHVHVCFY
jgi:hypothetical protein